MEMGRKVETGEEGQLRRIMLSVMYLKHVSQFVYLFVTRSDEDTDVRALVSRWLHHLEEDERTSLGGWIDDYFYKALEWVLNKVYLRDYTCV